MFVVAGCSGPLPNAVPLPLARSSPPVSHHLLHLPEIQSGMENPHPQPIYTSGLTSPVETANLTSCGVTLSRPDDIIIATEENASWFERFCTDMCEKVEGVTFVTTSSTWDRGHDAHPYRIVGVVIQLRRGRSVCRWENSSVAGHP